MKPLFWMLLLPAIALSRPTLAQTTPTSPSPLALTLDQVLNGRAMPLTIAPKDLNGEFRRLIVNDQSTLGNLQSMMIGAKTGIELNLYFTRGETVMLGGETYLIAYRPQTRIDMEMLNRHDNAVLPTQKLLPTTQLSLSLLNLRTVSSFNDIRPFDAKLDIESPQESDAATTRTLDRLGRDFITWIRTRGRGNFPALGEQVTPQLIRAMYPQVHDRREWMHPTTNEFFRPNPQLSKLRLSSIRNSRALVMFSEAKPARDGSRAVLFVDGHVERVAAGRFAQLQATKPQVGKSATPVVDSVSNAESL